LADCSIQLADYLGIIRRFFKRTLFIVLCGIGINGGAAQDVNYALLDSSDRSNIIHFVGYSRVIETKNTNLVLSASGLLSVGKSDKVSFPHIGIQLSQHQAIWRKNDWLVAQKFSLSFSRFQIDRGRYLWYWVRPQFELLGGYYRQKWIAGAKVGSYWFSSYNIKHPLSNEKKQVNSALGFIYAPMAGVTLWERFSIILVLGGESIIREDTSPQHGQLHGGLSINYHF
jgi:hypothetical protein